ncbi:hypothetical protein J2W14_002144 [Pseudarthrobacter oxydans]|uniref:hypothetical protein n=1 Tax=Pseudarthrobacter oxydans TaxID=1671 RepID=UPI00278B789A|nr:hypothetical protein [Pseudarthrobacter oxydans]MDP9982752.1 hypothetical protein [Pseudarthrobacter oxydans]
MARTHSAPVFLTGVLLLPVGWMLLVPLGGRVADAAYRSDEDFYTLLGLCGGLLILGSIFLILGSIFRALRKIDRLNSTADTVPAQQPASDEEPVA